MTDPRLEPTTCRQEAEAIPDGPGGPVGVLLSDEARLAAALAVTWNRKNYTLLYPTEDGGWILAATAELDKRRGMVQAARIIEGRWVGSLHWERNDSIVHLSPKRFRNEVTP